MRCRCALDQDGCTLGSQRARGHGTHATAPRAAIRRPAPGVTFCCPDSTGCHSHNMDNIATVLVRTCQPRKVERGGFVTSVGRRLLGLRLLLGLLLSLGGRCAPRVVGACPDSALREAAESTAQRHPVVAHCASPSGTPRAPGRRRPRGARANRAAPRLPPPAS